MARIRTRKATHWHELISKGNALARIDLDLIESNLETYIIGKSGKNEVWDQLISTNDRAIELAGAGSPEGVLVLARQQLGGRGRQGRNWVSPVDSGIFLSIVLRPTIDAAMLPLISFVAGVAAAEAIAACTQVNIGLKWVNDLVYDGRKLGGILAEVPGSKQGASYRHEGVILPPPVIIGVGINLSITDEDLPAEMKGRTTSLDLICAKVVDANLVVAGFCKAFEDHYNHLRHSAGELVLAEWRKYSHTLGKRIKTTYGGEDLEGTACDISENGALILQLDNGDLRHLHAGEISIRLEDGRYC